jgi:replicative DNA helicase
MSPSTLQNLEQYGHSFQVKVIYTLLNDKTFLDNIYDALTEEYFSNQSLQWIVKEIINYYEKYNCPITLDALKIELQKINNEVLKVAIKEQLKLAYKTLDDDLEYVREEFSTFCKNQQLKKALLNSVDLLNAGDYDSIRILIDNALKAGQDKNIGHYYDRDVEIRFKEDYRNPIPTPWNDINELTQGGLGGGDFGLIFGNPGGGKSWMLISLAGYAVKLGYNVIYYTLELGESYVGKRFDSYFTEIPVNYISNHKKEVKENLEKLKGKLIIAEFPPLRASIMTLENHIKKVTSQGIKPDLILIDYVDLLSTRKKVSDRKSEIDDIYISTKGLARSLNIPIWSVSQVNRAGAKDDIVEGDKAAGSYDKIMISDVCLSLSRKKLDKVNGTGRLHIMKNRYGMDGMTYNCTVDTSTGHSKLLEEYDASEEKEKLDRSPLGFYGKPTTIDTFDKKYLSEQFFNLNK